jgi:hypothetical protein
VPLAIENPLFIQQEKATLRSTQISPTGRQTCKDAEENLVTDLLGSGAVKVE